MTNNEPNVKLPLPVASISLNGLCMSGLVYTEYGNSLDLRDGTNFYTEEQVRAAIALNAPGADAQGEPVCVTHAVAVQMARACAYAKKNTHSYLPQTVQEARAWEPHEWVIDAIRFVTHPAPTGVYAADEVEYEYEVWQSDAWQAGGSCTDLDTARNEASHYALMYGQDGPVTVKLYEKREITAALAALAEGE